MIKLDLRKNLKHLYRPSARKAVFIEVPEMQFAMIDGKIEPGHSPGDSPSFARALEALYGISYTLKFMSKRREVEPIDYPVMALEALWWVADGQFDISQPDQWYWRAMIMQPEHITGAMFEEAASRVAAKKENAALSKVRMERYHEGLCVQIMHIGPYSEEPKTVERIKAFTRENGHVMQGLHHEIYLGDPRRTRPENLKTVLRHAVAPFPAPA